MFHSIVLIREKSWIIRFSSLLSFLKHIFCWKSRDKPKKETTQLYKMGISWSYSRAYTVTICEQRFHGKSWYREIEGTFWTLLYLYTYLAQVCGYFVVVCYCWDDQSMLKKPEQILIGERLQSLTMSVSRAVTSRGRKATLICLASVTAYTLSNMPSAFKEALYLIRTLTGSRTLTKLLNGPLGTRLR